MKFFVKQIAGDATLGQLGELGRIILGPAERQAMRQPLLLVEFDDLRQNQPAHLGCTAAAKALRERGMLGIDRHDLAGRSAAQIFHVVNQYQIVLAAIALLPYLLRVLAHHSPAAMTMLGAGCAFGWGGVATKLAADDLAQGRLVAAAAWGLATGGASAVGLLSEAIALQSRPAIQVAPVVFVTQTVVPVALAPPLFGELFRETPLGGVPLLISLVLLVAGAGLLARSPLLVALMEGERVSHPSGSAPSPSAPSQETIRSTPSNEEADPSTVTTKISPARLRP